MKWQGWGPRSEASTSCFSCCTLAPSWLSGLETQQVHTRWPYVREALGKSGDRRRWRWGRVCLSASQHLSIHSVLGTRRSALSTFLCFILHSSKKYSLIHPASISVSQEKKAIKQWKNLFEVLGIVAGGGDRADLLQVGGAGSGKNGTGTEVVLEGLWSVLAEFTIGSSANECCIIPALVPSGRICSSRWLSCNQQVAVDQSQKFIVLRITSSMSFGLYFEGFLAIFSSFWTFFCSTYHMAGTLLGAEYIQIEISKPLASWGTQSRILKCERWDVRILRMVEWWIKISLMI